MVVDIAPVAEGIDICQCSGCGDGLAVGVVGVGSGGSAIGSDKLQHIALEIGKVVVPGGDIVGRVLQGVGVTVVVIEKVQNMDAGGVAVDIQPHELSVRVDVLTPEISHGLGQPQPVGIIGIGKGGGAVGGTDKPPSVAPGIGPGALAPSQRGLAAKQTGGV